MSTTLYSARIIEGPSPSQFALATAEGSSEEVALRLTLSEDGTLVHEQWATFIDFSSTRRSAYLDGMYTVQDGYWNIQYDPLRRVGHIVTVTAGGRVGYDDIIAARRAFFGTRPRHFIAVRYATWLR